MSGRGLGHTGGTLDKLESIPGYRTELTLDEFVAQVRDVGMAIIGQTGDLVPADKLLYGLRDVTATVDQLSLIAASIMSKKLAGGAQAIVLDVKVGDGAFMKTLEDARSLAETMLALGEQAGREVVCLLTDMDQPLGAAVGNALEVREALDTVRGHGPADFTELVLDACARLLALSDLGIDEAEGRRRAEAAVADGSRRGGLAPLDRGAGRHRRRVRAAARAGRPRGRRRPRAGYVVDARRDRRRQRGRAPRRGPAHEGGRDRPRGRGRLPREARRRGRGRRAARARSTRAPSEARRRGRARGARGATSSRDEPPPSGRVCCSRSSTEASATRAGTVARVPELPEVETVRRRLAPVLEGRALRARRDHRPAADAPVRPGRGRARARGRARRAGRSPRQVSDCSVRVGAGAAGSPPDDGVVAARRDWTAAEDDPHRRAVVTLDDGSDVAYRDVRRFGTWLLLEPDEVDAYIDARVGREPLARAYRAQAPRGAARRTGARRSRRRSSTSARSPASGTSTPTRRSGARGSIR